MIMSIKYTVFIFNPMQNFIVIVSLTRIIYIYICSNYNSYIYIYIPIKTDRK